MAQSRAREEREELESLEFSPCGWIRGVEFLVANARGARVYGMRARAEPSEESLSWQVEERALGRSGAQELRAYACTKKGPLFGTQSEAILAWIDPESDDCMPRAAIGAMPDRGGSWIPSCAQAPGSEPLALARIAELPDQALSELSESISGLLRARQIEREGRAGLARALSSA
jgi:hypothetical protein